MKELVLILLD